MTIVNVAAIILQYVVNRELGQSIWQESFYDVIIRSDTMFRCEWIYIDNNPDKWVEDELYVDMAGRRLEGKPPYDGK